MTEYFSSFFDNLKLGIGIKIVVPYLLLTLIVAGVGSYTVTNLVSNSLQDRFKSQLIDAGQVVSDTMVNQEETRLALLRTVTGTTGVPQSVADKDFSQLASLVPQIIANSSLDVVELIDLNGVEIYGWHRKSNSDLLGEARSGSDFANVPDIQSILNGSDSSKKAFLLEDSKGFILFTAGPIIENEQVVGVAMVGSYLEKIVTELTETAVARVTLYDLNGSVLATTVAGEQAIIFSSLATSPEQYELIAQQLTTSKENSEVIINNAENEVPFSERSIQNREYLFAFGVWRLRNQSFGLFSIGLPTNFIVSNSRNSSRFFTIVFFAATLVVLGLGFYIARRITAPLNRLVEIALDVAQGNLAQKTGIERKDEIGSLAESFDVMTDKLAERNQMLASQNEQLVTKASELSAVLSGILDGVILLNEDDTIVTENPTAEALLKEVINHEEDDELRYQLPEAFYIDPLTNKLSIDLMLKYATEHEPKKFRMGKKVVSASAAPTRTPDGKELGTVVVLRDVTREAEVEQLKDGFIVSLSHELRTPLTVIKGYTDLLHTTDQNFNDTQKMFLGTITEKTEELVGHINQLISISELQAGTLKIVKENCDLKILINDLVSNKWLAIFKNKNLQLILNLPKDPVLVYADPDRINWAIDNLLKNAHDYTLSGSATLTLSTINDQAQLSIKDTGVGIAAEHKSFLFTRFFRAENVQTFNVSGVGLGLFITRSLIELNGGLIWAESELNYGSNFSFSIPLISNKPSELTPEELLHD